ncbi:MAG: hypothetical protein KME64_12975 [Scytonematopsis contorta HA4267-MV1]|jgi:hypothetical protein|nr:hypothetical protein [Scytonematopsis contorta HA4267-MV1]
MTSGWASGSSFLMKYVETLHVTSLRDLLGFRPVLNPTYEIYSFFLLLPSDFVKGYKG